jgi:hypothetical protein
VTARPSVAGGHPVGGLDGIGLDLAYHDRTVVHGADIQLRRAG